MKIAVAAQGNQVSPHFGHCEKFCVFEVKDGQVVGKIWLSNPGHEPGLLPRLLADHGVNVVIAGGMGVRAQQLFAARGIEVVTGAAGPLEEVVAAYLAGNLSLGPNLCDH